MVRLVLALLAVAALLSGCSGDETRGTADDAECGVYLEDYPGGAHDLEANIQDLAPDLVAQLPRGPGYVDLACGQVSALHREAQTQFQDGCAIMGFDHEGRDYGVRAC